MGEDFAQVRPRLCAEAPERFLLNFATTVPADTHDTPMLDGAGWHDPRSVTIPLPHRPRAASARSPIRSRGAGSICASATLPAGSSTMATPSSTLIIESESRLHKRPNTFKAGLKGRMDRSAGSSSFRDVGNLARCATSSLCLRLPEAQKPSTTLGRRQSGQSPIPRRRTLRREIHFTGGVGDGSAGRRRRGASGETVLQHRGKLPSSGGFRRGILSPLPA